MTKEQRRVLEAAENLVGPVILDTASSELRECVRALRVAENRNVFSWDWHLLGVVSEHDPGDEDRSER